MNAFETIRSDDQATYAGNTVELESGLIVQDQQVNVPLGAIAELLTQ